MRNSCICWPDFVLLWWSKIPYRLLKKCKEHLRHSYSSIHLANSGSNCASSSSLILKSVGLQISIAIEKFSIFNSAGVEHCITIKEMISIAWRFVFWIWTISQIDTVDVSGYFPRYYFLDFVWLFFLNSSKISELCVAFFRWHVQLLIKPSLNWSKKHP